MEYSQRQPSGQKKMPCPINMTVIDIIVKGLAIIILQINERSWPARSTREPQHFHVSQKSGNDHFTNKSDCITKKSNNKGTQNSVDIHAPQVDSNNLYTRWLHRDAFQQLLDQVARVEVQSPTSNNVTNDQVCVCNSI